MNMSAQYRLTPLLIVGLAVFTAENSVAAFLSPSTAARNVNAAVTDIGSTHPAFLSVPRSSKTKRFLFGFGEKDETPDEGDLAKYSSLPAAKFDALSEYIRLWADLFEDESKQRMGLTTPVKIFPSKSDADGVMASSGARIVFQKTKTGDKYTSKKEDKKVEDSDAAKRKKKKERLEGGVEVLVETLDGGDMVVRARRCDVDEDTLIKEMSEETILKELKRAMDVWRRDNK